jgi:hypothetical protein
MRSTRSCRRIRARRPDVYRALLDPAAVALADNEAGTAMALDRLAALLEGDGLRDP